MGLPLADFGDAFADALLEVGRACERVVVLDADIADSCKTEAFRSAFPKRAFDLGVAEQSLPTFAAGLALAGKIPFYNSFAPFAALRGLDMIRQSVAYNRANVKIVGHAAGQSMGYTGPTHHTIEDIAALRAIPGIVILTPCDAEQTRQMVWVMANTEGAMYLRLPRGAAPPVHPPDFRFQIGRTYCLRRGGEVTIFACGAVVALAMQAAERLAGQGILCQVVDVPTLKPLAAGEILRHGEHTRGAITVEDHNVLGGLGGAVAEIYGEELQKPVVRIGIPDRFTESDEGHVLREACGLSVQSIVSAAQRLGGRV